MNSTNAGISTDGFIKTNLESKNNTQIQKIKNDEIHEPAIKQLQEHSSDANQSSELFKQMLFMNAINNKRKAIPHDIALTGSSLAGTNPCHSYTS